MALLATGNAKTMDTLLGGRHQIIKEVYERFFQKLKDNGATLAFFSDGPIQEEKFNAWILRQNQRYLNTCQLFDEINCNSSIEDVCNDQFFQIPQIATFVDQLHDITRKVGTLKIADHHECDAELAQYATVNNALAVLTNDTDFLIFEGNWRLWCTDVLSIKSFTTMELSRSALIRHLGLTYEQMPLFATLAGNDFVAFDRIKAFLGSLGRNNYPFLNLAQFIGKMKKMPSNLNDDDLADLSALIFRNRDLANIALIKKSINSYDLNVEMSQPNDSDELLRRCAGMHTIYDCLANLTTTLSMPYFDLREPDFMPYFDLLAPIYRRQYGILLQHQRHMTPTRKCQSKASHDAPIQVFTLTPDYPERKFSGNII